MNSNYFPSSDSEINPYAPPKATSIEPVPGTQLNATSPARCATSWLLGSVSIVLSVFEFGLFATVLTVPGSPPRLDRILRPEFLAVMFGWLGLAAALGGLGLWLVRAELGAARSISLGASAVKFCVGALVATVCDAIFLSVFTIYIWLT